MKIFDFGSASTCLEPVFYADSKSAIRFEYPFPFNCYAYWQIHPNLSSGLLLWKFEISAFLKANQVTWFIEFLLLLSRMVKPFWVWRYHGPVQISRKWEQIYHHRNSWSFVFYMKIFDFGFGALVLEPVFYAGF